MYAVIFKESGDRFVVIDAYYKGRWEADRGSLLAYLCFLAAVQHLSGGKVGRPVDPRQVDEETHKAAARLGVDAATTASLLDFVRAEGMPVAANFAPLAVAAGIDDRAPGIITPATPILEVTAHCNYRCPWCYIPDRDVLAERYTLEEFQENIVLPLLRRYGLLEWCLTGGEPSVDKKRTIDMARVITGCSRQVLGRDPLSIYILTNGYNLAANIEEFMAAGINCYQVALSSPVPEHEAALRRPPRGVDSYQHAVDGLRAARRAGARVEVNMIIQPPRPDVPTNLNEIPQMIELARGLGLDMLRLIPAVPCGMAKKNRIMFTREEYREIARLVREGRPRIPDIEVDCPLDQPIEPDREVYCRAGTLWVYVNFRGQVFPCNNLQEEENLCSAATIRSEPLDRIWEQSELLNLMRDFRRSTLDPRCVGCECRAECAGECRAMAWARYRAYDLAQKPSPCFREADITTARGY